MEHVPCPLCGGLNHKLLFSRPDYTHQATDEQFSVVRCLYCRFVFVNPRPSLSEINKYYPKEFYDAEVTPERLLEEKRGTLCARLKLLAQLPPGRLLDIGCQKGEFLYIMKQRGWDVHGVEFSKTPPNLFELPIYYGIPEDAPFEAGSFDLITLWAVLEHVHDPVSLLRAVKHFLKPTGRALVLVPNFNSIPARFMRQDDLPRHLLMFTKGTLRIACAHAGLRIEKFVFGDDIFSGSTRGVFNYVWKLAHGERLKDIVAQNRSPGRWEEFSNYLNGKKSDVMLKVDRLDIRVTPYLDRIVNLLGFGFIMTAELTRVEE